MATIDNKAKSYLVVNNDGRLQDLAGNITWTNTAQIAQGAGVHGGDCLYFDNSEIVEVEVDNNTEKIFNISSELYGTLPANTFNFNAETWTLSFWVKFESPYTYNTESLDENDELIPSEDETLSLFLKIGDFAKIELWKTHSYTEGEWDIGGKFTIGEKSVTFTESVVPINDNWFHLTFLKIQYPPDSQLYRIYFYINGERPSSLRLDSDFVLPQTSQQIVFCKEDVPFQSTEGSVTSSPLYYKMYLDEFLFVEDDIYNFNGSRSITEPTSYAYDLPPSSIMMEWPKNVFNKFKSEMVSLINNTNSSLLSIQSSLHKIEKIATITSISKSSFYINNTHGEYGSVQTTGCILNVSCPNFSFNDGELFYLDFTIDSDSTLYLLKQHFQVSGSSPACNAPYAICMNNQRTLLFLNSSTPVINSSNNGYSFNSLFYKNISLINKIVLCVYRDGTNLPDLQNGSSGGDLKYAGYFQLLDNINCIQYMTSKDYFAYINAIDDVDGYKYIRCAGQSLPNYKDGFPSNVTREQCYYSFLAYHIKSVGGSYHYFGGDATDDTTFTLPTISSEFNITGAANQRYKYIRI